MSDINKLQEENIKLRNDRSKLIDACGNACKVISRLQDDYTELDNGYDDLEKDYFDLDERHKRLHKAIGMFMIKHSHCQEIISEIENQYKINEADEY
ncbi:hypothetical protein [Priestia megaterium]|uniref:hypothetical protein n=1 Tax=Priestia megaterium TaxID=1404 RepID=UPI003CC5C489